MKTDLNRPLVAASFIALCVTGVLLFQRASDSTEMTSPEAPETIETPASPETLPPRPQPTSLDSAAAPAIVPLEPPEDPDEAREWARKNPHDALAWMLKAPAGDKRDTVAEMACARLAESDPARAVSLAEGYAGGCSNLVENLVHQWAEQNEPAATAYAISKPPGEERDRLLSRVALTRSKENPMEAAKLVAEWISPGEVQNEAAISVLHQWALRDPNAALDWAQMFSDDALRARALTEVENTSLKRPD
jgi:hypothetical protein